jgi:hypothetical protein
MKPAKPQLFIALHTHAHGISIYPFIFTPTKAEPAPDEEEVTRRFDIDFEPDKEEFLDIEPQCPADAIPHLRPARTRRKT